MEGASKYKHQNLKSSSQLPENVVQREWAGRSSKPNARILAPSLARGSVVVVASWSRRNIGFPCLFSALKVWRNGGEISLEPKSQMRDPCVCTYVKLWSSERCRDSDEPPQISRIHSQWNPSPPSQEFSVLDIVVFWKLTNPPPPPRERERERDRVWFLEKGRGGGGGGAIRLVTLGEFEKVSKLWTFSLNSSCFFFGVGSPGAVLCTLQLMKWNPFADF